MKITIIGHVCIDNNISESVTYTTAGSPAMFMNKIYKKFPDVLTNIIAPYGRDFETYTKAINIFPKKSIGELTLIYENKSQGNLRTQKALNREYAKPLIIDNELKRIVAESDIIFFAPLTPDYSVPYVTELIKFTQESCLKILLPQGYYRSFDQENNVIQRDFIEAELILPLFDFVIVSEQDHKEMEIISKKWSEKIKVIMTLGDKGVGYFYKNESIVVPVEKVEAEDIVDSVGSGDIFSASFGFKYFLTKDIKKSLEFANNIARQCLFYSADNLQFVLPE